MQIAILHSVSRLKALNFDLCKNPKLLSYARSSDIIDRISHLSVCLVCVLTWLYIWLSLISFFFLFNDFLETNYLTIQWTSFYDSLKEVAIATNLGQNLQNDLHSTG